MMRMMWPMKGTHPTGGREKRVKQGFLEEVTSNPSNKDLYMCLISELGKHGYFLMFIMPLIFLVFLISATWLYYTVT